jgi:hypothetical protein
MNNIRITPVLLLFLLPNYTQSMIVPQLLVRTMSQPLQSHRSIQTSLQISRKYCSSNGDKSHPQPEQQPLVKPFHQTKAAPSKSACYPNWKKPLVIANGVTGLGIFFLGAAITGFNTVLGLCNILDVGHTKANPILDAMVTVMACTNYFGTAARLAKPDKDNSTGLKGLRYSNIFMGIGCNVLTFGVLQNGPVGNETLIEATLCFIPGIISIVNARQLKRMAKIGNIRNNLFEWARQFDEQALNSPYVYKAIHHDLGNIIYVLHQELPRHKPAQDLISVLVQTPAEINVEALKTSIQAIKDF